ncbi:hypothetical protein [Neorhizobium sp. JUb45]|uniref:hypothetical protein n=1 Tax=Neorhizobium sp. JUb45 TaxID=2485113 RepID=UPI0014045D45|nr:hypothetical protein [Neorhizobium sp. JUb45]
MNEGKVFCDTKSTQLSEWLCPFPVGHLVDIIGIRSHHTARHYRISIVRSRELHNDTGTTGSQSKAGAKGQFMQNIPTIA